MTPKSNPAQQVFHEYKEQSCVELSFRVIKEPEFVGTMYVKKPKRLEALILRGAAHLHLFAQ